MDVRPINNRFQAGAGRQNELQLPYKGPFYFCLFLFRRTQTQQIQPTQKASKDTNAKRSPEEKLIEIFGVCFSGFALMDFDLGASKCSGC